MARGNGDSQRVYERYRECYRGSWSMGNDSKGIEGHGVWVIPVRVIEGHGVWVIPVRV